MDVQVIGAGLAGCEAAFYLAEHGFRVDLIDEKPLFFTPAHRDANLGELVCSNSLKSESMENACGLLKYEMRELGSLVLMAADKSRIKAGQDLAVDRDSFSNYLTKVIFSHKNIRFISKKVCSLSELSDKPTILATGPLTEPELLKDLQQKLGEETLSFYDSAAPLIFAGSLDMSRLYKKSRYDKGDGEYLNCALDRFQYEDFVSKIVEAPTVVLHDFEHFEGCLPLETMAKRGRDTLRFGPLKATGLARDGQTAPYAVVQLRQDDAAARLYNMVGFQTNMTFKAQKEIFSTLPGFKNVRFARFGVMHRNSYICAPAVLARNLSLKKIPSLKIAGQLSGVEGYVESAASGLLAAIYTAQELKTSSYDPIPLRTMLGSLINYLIMASPKHFAPMNSTYGILRAGTKDKTTIFQQSLEAIRIWKEKNNC